MFVSKIMIMLMLFISSCEGIRIKPVPNYYIAKNPHRSQEICNNNAFAVTKNTEMFDCLKGNYYELSKCINLNNFDEYSKLYSKCTDYNLYVMHVIILVSLVITLFNIIHLMVKK